MRLLNALAWPIAAIVVLFALPIPVEAADDPSATPIHVKIHDRVLHSINASALEQQPKEDSILHILDGRSNKVPAVGESLAPGRIRTESIHRQGDQFVVSLSARSVTIIELPLR
jgi:hypothetical protein